MRNSLEEVAKRAAKGSRHPRVNTWARNTLEMARNRGQKVKTPRDRATVLLGAVQKKLWVPDPVGTEYIAGAHLLACDDESDGQVCIKAADCFPESTLLLTSDHELVPVESLRPGVKIWGLDRWSTVEAVAYKGTLAIDVIKLNNGSELKLTADHKVYVLDCNEHPMLDDEHRALLPDHSGCFCDAILRIEKRIRVSELRPNMTLTQPKHLPLANMSIEQRRRQPQEHEIEHAWQLKVKSIERAVVHVPCWDIQTDDHRVYLPEHDVTVSNCDELVVVLAAALSSVGIYTMIVGHAYDQQQRIEHVLCAVHLEDKWHYADPSTQMPLGRCTPFSRERLLSMPNVQVLCDQRSCLNTRSFNPSDLNFVDKGVFVGVDGPPELTLAGLASNFAWLSEDADWLGQVTVIDLKDSATMIEVKRMMRLLKQGYASASPTWSPSDWLAYSQIVNLMSGELGVSKGGNVAYAEDGQVIGGKWPPSDKLGFPSYLGIQNMVEDIVKLGLLKKSDVKIVFPKITSYGQNVIAVTAPNFAAETTAKRGGIGAGPIILGLLVLGGVGLALTSSREE